MEYKDDAAAFNGLKKGIIRGKGIINNRITNHLMKMLEGKGIPTHFIQEISSATCRFLDTRTGEKLDKDHFRRDMGGVGDAYHEMMYRLMGE